MLRNGTFVELSRGKQPGGHRADGVIKENTAGHEPHANRALQLDVPGSDPAQMHQDKPPIPTQHTDPNRGAHKTRACALQKLTDCKSRSVGAGPEGRAEAHAVGLFLQSPQHILDSAQGPTWGLGSAAPPRLLSFPQGPTAQINLYVDFTLASPKNLVTSPWPRDSSQNPGRCPDPEERSR